jgi:hypothetical protein
MPDDIQKLVFIFRCVRKIAKSDLSCLSVRMEQIDSHWTDIREILYLSTFRKSVEKNESFIEIWQE